MAVKWKELHQQEKLFNEEVKRRIQQQTEVLEYEIEQASIEHKTFMLKEDLRRRQEELERIEERRKADILRRQEMEQKSVSNFDLSNFDINKTDKIV
jgi:hypothetical protein